MKIKITKEIVLPFLLSFFSPFVGLWHISFEGKAMCLPTSTLKFCPFKTCGAEMLQL